MKFYKYILSWRTTTLIIDSNPAGWDEKGITYTRSDIYHSILRSGTGGVRFVDDGKEYIDNIVEGYGINEEISIIIYERNPISHQYDRVFFEGILDLSTWKSDIDFTEVELIDGSIESKFTTRDEIEVNVFSEKTIDNEDVTPFTNSPIEIELSPINLFRFAIGLINETIDYVASITETITDYLKLYDVSKNDLGDKIAFTETIYTNTDESTYEINCKGDINLQGEIIGVGIDSGVPCSVKTTITLEVYTDVGGLFTSRELYVNTFYLPAFPSYEYFLDVSESFSFDENINGVSNDYYIKLKLETLYKPTGSAQIDSDIIYTSTNFQVIEKSQSYPATNCKGLLSYELASRLIQIMTDEVNTDKLIYSEVLGRTDSEFQTYSSDGEASLQFHTNGFLIRRYNDKSLNISFRDFFKSISARVPLGCWYDRVNERFVIEKYEEFYRKEEIFNLGEVSELKIYNAKDWYFNTIKTGYNKKVVYEEFTGVNEINTYAEYSTIVNKFKNTLDLTSSMRGDSVGIELARRAGKTSDDTKYDTDNFIIDCLRDGDIRPHIGSDLTSVLSEDIINIEEYYNLRYTPKRIMTSNKKKFTGGLNYNKTSYIKFIKNQFDNDVNTQGLTEKSDLLVSTIFNPNTLPFLYDFECPMTWDLIEQLESDPHGYLTFTNNGKTFKGFLIESGPSGYRKKGNFLLIKVNML